MSLLRAGGVTQVEEYHRVDNEVGARYHRWSFGKSLQRGDLRGGYVMKLTTVGKATTGGGTSAAGAAAAAAAGPEVLLEWTYGGLPCTGRYVPAAAVLVLQFMLRTAVIVATYRIIDANRACGPL